MTDSRSEDVPTRAPGPTDQGEQDAPHRTVDAVCSACGSWFDSREWHPVAAEREDGSLRVYEFCSQSCRDAWED